MNLYAIYMYARHTSNPREVCDCRLITTTIIITTITITIIITIITITITIIIIIIIIQARACDTTHAPFTST